jgi:ADP-ribose pyrophosphatase YjhB (NUDIX family)
MSRARFTVIPTVCLVLRRDDTVLLARRCNTGFHDGEYSLPAGYLDGGETLVQALIFTFSEVPRLLAQVMVCDVPAVHWSVATFGLVTLT